ncbi:MAG: chemotaxis protein CheW [Clostridia bacterium]|nr:chemotaxis protein CheW [Clostridia bacterium]
MAPLMEETVELLEDTQKGMYLTFFLGKEEFGIEIKYVTEIIGIQAITSMPELPEYIQGIINLRGKIIPVMDVRRRFKKEPREYNDRTCIVVVAINDLSMGLIVDEVAEVLAIPEGDIVPPPELKTTVSNKYIKAIGKAENSVKLLLDCGKLLADGEVEGIIRVD